MAKPITLENPVPEVMIGASDAKTLRWKRQNHGRQWRLTGTMFSAPFNDPNYSPLREEKSMVAREYGQAPGERYIAV